LAIDNVDVAAPPSGRIDAESDIECSEQALNGGDEEVVFTSAYAVEDGELGGLCFGDDGPPADDTLAFVTTLDSDGSGFQMSINTIDAEADPDELLLTIAHEFSHVFAATADQLDRSDEAIDACASYFNGEGCYLDDSLLNVWIDEFWDPGVLAGVDPTEESVDDAEARCADDDGFFGPNGATNPEEDFAEAFSAFVFAAEPATVGQAERLRWIETQPGLVEFRDRAEAAGMSPLSNAFDVCGV